MSNKQIKHVDNNNYNNKIIKKKKTIGTSLKVS